MAKTALPVPSPSATTGALLLLDKRTGRLIRRVDTGSDPLDVLAIAEP